MKILILSWRGPGHPNAGGAEQVTFEHAKGWVQAGHEVTLFTSYFPKAKKEETLDGIRIVRKGEYVIGVKIAAIFWYIFRKHLKFDFVIDEFHGIPFFTPLYVRTRKLSFIHEVAGEVWKLNPWPKPYNLIPAFIGKYLEPLVFKMFYMRTPFFTVSESTKNDLISIGIPPKNISVIHNGVKLFLPKEPLTKELTPTAMYLGAISEDKGTLDAIKSFAEINRKDDMWRFWVVGFGNKDLILKLKELAKELGIEEKVEFFGYVSDKKKFELLSLAHIVINPSVHEGWCLVNIEANSVGTPVIAYDVNGVRDSVRAGKTGLLVEKGDHRGLAAKTLELFRNKSKYADFQKECIKWSKNFTWEKATKESRELIESI